MVTCLANTTAIWAARCWILLYSWIIKWSNLSPGLLNQHDPVWWPCIHGFCWSSRVQQLKQSTKPPCPSYLSVMCLETSSLRCKPSPYETVVGRGSLWLCRCWNLFILLLMLVWKSLALSLRTNRIRPVFARNRVSMAVVNLNGQDLQVSASRAFVKRIPQNLRLWCKLLPCTASLQVFGC